MKLIKSTAEAVMESLWMLLIILFNQIEIKAPDQVISEHHASSLQNLLEQVNVQKDRIEELSKILQDNRSPRKTRVSPGTKPPSRGDLSDHSWELEEEEMMLTNANALPASPPTRTSTRIPVTATATTKPIRLTPENQQENQLALTAQAIESWGSKRVSWGKTHNGKRFMTVYEEFPQYVDWITARASTANAAMQDFITYSQARNDMEHQALMGRR